MIQLLLGLLIGYTWPKSLLAGLLTTIILGPFGLIGYLLTGLYIEKE